MPIVLLDLCLPVFRIQLLPLRHVMFLLEARVLRALELLHLPPLERRVPTRVAPPVSAALTGYLLLDVVDVLLGLDVEVGLGHRVLLDRHLLPILDLDVIITLVELRLGLLLPHVELGSEGNLLHDSLKSCVLLDYLTGEVLRSRFAPLKQCQGVELHSKDIFLKLQSFPFRVDTLPMWDP